MCIYTPVSAVTQNDAESFVDLDSCPGLPWIVQGCPTRATIQGYEKLSFSPLIEGHIGTLEDRQPVAVARVRSPVKCCEICVLSPGGLFVFVWPPNPPLEPGATPEERGVYSMST